MTIFRRTFLKTMVAAAVTPFIPKAEAKPMVSEGELGEWDGVNVHCTTSCYVVSDSELLSFAPEKIWKAKTYKDKLIIYLNDPYDVWVVEEDSYGYLKRRLLSDEDCKDVDMFLGIMGASESNIVAINGRRFCISADRQRLCEESPVQDNPFLPTEYANRLKRKYP